MSFILVVPAFEGRPYQIDLMPASSTFFVGPNGSGKTRLAAQAESNFGPMAHRISAHRALNLNPNVHRVSEKQALSSLRSGSAVGRLEQDRIHHRWSNKAATNLLNDFDYLIQALFAEQANTALETHNAAHAGTLDQPNQTRFQKLVSIWERILPHCVLQVTGDDIRATRGSQPSYSASEMSDGERAIFYLLGQALMAAPDSVLIFDEPELHVHRAILSRLWDEVEAARPDCALLVITHDLEFAASRPGQKFAIRGYQTRGQWELEPVPGDTGFSEEVTTLILGSRKPILFVEGAGASLDIAIYRACYSNWTVVPRGSCENVIHAVATMRNNERLTHITCSGIVDADDYSAEDKKQLNALGVAVLPVSEIENLFLLPLVSTAILEEEKFQGQELHDKLDALKHAVVTEITRPSAINEVVLRYCRRRIDRALKKIDFTDATAPNDLANAYLERTAALDVAAIAQEVRDRIEESIEKGDLETLLANFDNKALLALAAKHLKSTTKTSFESWLTRAMRDPKAERLKAALDQVLPRLEAY